MLGDAHSIRLAPFLTHRPVIFFTSAFVCEDEHPLFMETAELFFFCFALTPCRADTTSRSWVSCEPFDGDGFILPGLTDKSPHSWVSSGHGSHNLLLFLDFSIRCEKRTRTFTSKTNWFSCHPSSFERPSPLHVASQRSDPFL